MATTQTKTRECSRGGDAAVDSAAPNGAACASRDAGQQWTVWADGAHLPNEIELSEDGAYRGSCRLADVESFAVGLRQCRKGVHIDATCGRGSMLLTRS